MGSQWKDSRVLLRIRSDSVSALVLAVRLKSSGFGPNLVAREMALDIAESVYRPDIAEHIPGIANRICDDLSRLFVPGQEKSIPRVLENIPRVTLPRRDRSFFRTLVPPSRGSQHGNGSHFAEHVGRKETRTRR